jgi:site-specific DNA recombinase
MFLKIIGIFAEFERENLVTRLKLGFERKVKEGYTLATNIITYGYIREKGQKIQTIDPEESKIVREIFSMFVDKNISMNKIAKTLNERKVPTKMNVASWEGTTIKTILVNPTYIGKVRYSTEDKERYFEADGHHEPIISEKLFNLASEKIRNTAQIIRTKRPKTESYFCGILKCGICQNRFTTRNYKTAAGYKTAYRCFTKKSCNTEKCTCPDINHEKIECAFIDYIRNINDITENGKITADETAKNTEKDLLKSIVDCEKRLTVLHDRKKQVMEQYVGGDIEFDEYKKMIAVFNDKYETLENELQRQKTELSAASKKPEVLPEDIVLNIKQNWEHLNNTEKMIFLQRFIKKIVITVEKQRVNLSRVKIESVEFNTDSAIAISQNRPSLRENLRER